MVDVLRSVCRSLDMCNLAPQLIQFNGYNAQKQCPCILHKAVKPGLFLEWSLFPYRDLWDWIGTPFIAVKQHMRKVTKKFIKIVLSDNNYL